MKYIIANWKMNPESWKEAKAIVLGIKDAGSRAKQVATVICPPTLFVPDVGRLVRSPKIRLGAQDAYFEKSGAYTGQISPSMLKDCGVSHLIVGHSERRREGDTDEIVQKKLKSALSLGFTVIVCVGEKERDEHGFYLAHVEAQLASALKGTSRKDVSRVIIAYEPIWAIGKSAARAATAEEIEHMMLYIRKIIVGIHGKPAAKHIRTIYGGSVDVKETPVLIGIPYVDGLLVGRESLNPKNFSEIIRIADRA